MEETNTVTLKLYRHLKTGNLYLACAEAVTNSTNAQDGQRMVLYRPITSPTWYVREQQEFLQKFQESVLK